MSSNFIEIHRHSVRTPWTYADLESRQNIIRGEVHAGKPGRLVFSEVAPVVTLGFRKINEDLILPRESYSDRGIAVLEVSRGGRATYHGPGQWVIFPIDRLERLTGDSRGVRKFVEALLGAVLEGALDRFPNAEIRDGKEAGVWSASGAKGAKFAALGIRIVDGIVQHGVSINVFSTPESFVGILPCGLDAPVGFLAKTDGTSDEIAFLAWRERLEKALLARFPLFRG